MNPGKPIKIIEIEPLVLPEPLRRWLPEPLPEPVPPEPEPEPEEVPA